MQYLKLLTTNIRPVLPYLVAFFILWFLSGCASTEKPRPYIPAGASLNGGTVSFYRWAY